MAGWVRVVVEDLQLSASTVDAHADTMHMRHVKADGQIEGAQRGLPPGAAAALGAATTKWQADSATLFRGLVGHSDGLRTAASNYARTDEHSAAKVADASEQIMDLGL